MTGRNATTTKNGKRAPHNQKHKPRGRTARATVELSDGTTAVCKARPSARQREADHDVASTYELIAAILAQPLTFRLFDDVPRDPGQFGGSQRTWPNELHSALFVLQFVYPELRLSIRELTGDPHRKALLVKRVTANVHDTHARKRFTAAINAGRFPSRSTIIRYRQRYVDAATMNDSLIHCGIDLAVRRGHFDPASIRKGSDPRWQDLVYSDGTVLKPPSDETFHTAIDPDTGEIWHPKIDVDSRKHKQSSDSEPIVNGTKLTALLTRKQGYQTEIFLGMCITRKPDPASEAHDAIDLVDMARTYLQSTQPTANFQALSHDGAATTKHHKRLIARGTLLMNYPPAKTSHTDPSTGKKTREAEHIGDLGTWHHNTTDCPGHRLTGIAGDIHTQEKVNGKITYRKLNHQPSAKTTKGKTYWYENIELTCPASRRSTRPGSTKDRIIRMPWHQGRDETQVAYNKRVQYARPWGPSSPTGTRLRGVRQSVENRFAMLDREFPFTRVPAYSEATKISLALGYAIGHNLAMAGLGHAADP